VSNDPSDTRPERCRALLHVFRTPLNAARLRLRLTAQGSQAGPRIDSVEADLAAADDAVARLLPLAAGVMAPLDPRPGDLAQIVVAAMRMPGKQASLETPATLPGNWDRFAVECIVRNLLALVATGSVEAASFRLKAAEAGAMLSVAGSSMVSPPDDARRWLIEQLATAHGGWSTFFRAPGLATADVFLARGRVGNLRNSEHRFADGPGT
jgi:hypothetical protein